MSFHEESLAQLSRHVSDSDLVLDVGGWHAPWSRADHVVDIMPYETRNRDGAVLKDMYPNERFTRETFHQMDICSLCEVEGTKLSFLFNPAMLHAYRQFHLVKPWFKKMNPSYGSVGFFWKGTFSFEEKIIIDRDEVQENLRTFKKMAKALPRLFVWS